MTITMERASTWETRPGWGIAVDLTPGEIVQARQVRSHKRLIVAGLVLVLVAVRRRLRQTLLDKADAQDDYDNAQATTTTLQSQATQYADITTMQATDRPGRDPGRHADGAGRRLRQPDGQDPDRAPARAHHRQRERLRSRNSRSVQTLRWTPPRTPRGPGRTTIIGTVTLSGSGRCHQGPRRLRGQPDPAQGRGGRGPHLDQQDRDGHGLHADPEHHRRALHPPLRPRALPSDRPAGPAGLARRRAWSGPWCSWPWPGSS